jgi:CDP-paratose 2-epimerase
MAVNGVSKQARQKGVALVTGGAGFIGCGLVDRLAASGHDVVVFDALTRAGVEANLAWLMERHPKHVTPIIADVRDADALGAAVAKARVVFHFAAQVAVTRSIARPREDFDINLGGTFNLLEALRERDAGVPLIFASTNKVYGNLPDVALERVGDAYAPRDEALRARGIGEDRSIEFHTPYGCSKGAADQYVQDYCRTYRIPAAVMRMSCIYGPRQMGTEDQGWVAHFLINALEGRPINIFGDGYQVRDVLHVSDVVDAYIAAWERIDAIGGRAFNLGGGPTNAVSLRQLLAHVATIVERPLDIRFFDWRPGDQRYYVSDTRRATRALGLKPPMPWREGVDDLARWLRQREARDASTTRDVLREPMEAAP